MSQIVHLKVEIDTTDILDRYWEEIVACTQAQLEEIYRDGSSTVIPSLRIDNARIHLLPGNKMVVPVEVDVERASVAEA